jgi:methyltransferase (TIGR00027 family)
MRHGQASRTADRVAARRASHQLLDNPLVLDDPLALTILSAETRALLVDDPHAFDPSPLSPLLRAFFVVRSRVAEDALAEAIVEGVTQYVVLGAGFDTSAYRPPSATNPALRVYEIDHPATQEVKRERLIAGGIEIPANVTFIATDLSQIALRDALHDARFDFDQPAFISWLGVVPYLTLDAITATLATLGSLPRGSGIVFDYGIPPSSLSGLARVVFDRMAKRVAAAGEPWITFFEPDELRHLLERCGFARVDDFDSTALSTRYLANRTDGLRLGPTGHVASAWVGQ